MPDREKQKGSLWTGRFLTVFVINILVNVSLYMVNTLIPKLADYLAAPVAVIGAVVSMFAVTSLLARPFVGVSGSFLREELILRLSASVLVVAYALFGFARSVPVVIAGRLIQGVGMAFVGPVCLTLAANALPQSRISSGIAIFSIAQASANAFGPSIGLWLSARFGYTPAFLISSALMLGCLFLSFNLPRSEEPTREKLHLSVYSVISREALIPGIIFFFLGGAYSCIVSYVVLYGESCGVTNCGLFFTSYAVFVVLSRLISGRIGEKYGLSSVIVPAIICYAASFYFISISRSTLMFVLAGAVSALGYGVCQPSLQALSMLQVPD